MSLDHGREGGRIRRMAKPLGEKVKPLGAKMASFVPMPRQAMSIDPTMGVLGRLGGMEVRLARSREEIKAAQQLRYHVFYEEMAAQPSALQRMTRRDKDGFDRYCDHLLVIDTQKSAVLTEQIVGTYRLMRDTSAALAGGFYTASEFDIGPMILRHPGKRFLELGRSCVLKDYRGKRTVELLWQGIWAYVLHHKVDVLFGCASLSGTELSTLTLPLTFLANHAKAPDEWRVAALPHRSVVIPGECPDPKRALAQLPPLLKGYLRLGGYIGEGAVVDYQFGTTDVLVVLPVENINPRYIGHYGADAGRFAA
ncbi:ornithine-acyl[acyl carrier protein] N-acyltransferase [Consotaella salsifontis]|uniref:L-ornithine N(alpha)-acyltransferase n=2 Tax=Consotaella salsifontis TaxID=1365950 RepID=A0A1T4QGB3_9HYPH|nr:ornithine-acyl[acyl carrier protein] N-acyltransferase [Consotaella salsifontis]